MQVVSSEWFKRENGLRAMRFFSEYEEAVQWLKNRTELPF